MGTPPDRWLAGVVSFLAGAIGNDDEPGCWE